MAYATHNGARQDTDKLIFPSPWSYIFMSLWIAGAIAASIALTVHWTSCGLCDPIRFRSIVIRCRTRSSAGPG
jgi:hypothetical protein